MTRYKVNTVLAFLPLHGYAGDAINEGQLVNALSKYVKSIYCFTYASLYQILSRKRQKIGVSLNTNIKVIDIPTLPLSYFFLIINLLYHFIIACLYISIGWLLKPDVLYVRNRLLAFNLQIFKCFINKPILYKFDNFAIDEVIPTIRQSIFRGFLAKTLWLIDYSTLRNSDIILVLSKLMEMDIRKRVGMIKGRVVVCPPGIDMEKIKRIKKDKPHIQNGKVRIGFIGTLAWWQGVDVLAQAVSIVNKIMPNVELFIVGDGPLRKKIEEICKLNNVYCIITGFVTHEKALNYLRPFDVLVLPRPKTPTTERVIPIKVIEAQALGVPLIVTRHKVFIEMGLKDKEHLLYCNPEPLDVANKILLLLEDKQLKLKISENSIAFAEKFSYDRIAANVFNVLQSHYFAIKSSKVRLTA